MRERTANKTLPVRLISLIALCSLFVLLLILFGCSTEKNDDEVTNESVVLYVKDGAVLLADIETEAVYFPYIPEGGLFSQEGEKIDVSELVPGDIVSVVGNGIMAESYPAQYPGITRIDVIGFDDALVSQYDYIIARVFAEDDPDEVPTAQVEYTIEDIGSITVALEAFSYMITGSSDPQVSDGSCLAEDGTVLEGVPDMVINDTNEVTVSFSRDIDEASVMCIPLDEVQGKGLVADSNNAYSIVFDKASSSLTFDVNAGHLYTLDVSFENGEASYSFVVKS